MKEIKLFFVVLMPIFIYFLSMKTPRTSNGFNDYSESINKFTFKLYEKLHSGNCNDNVFFSGFSIHSALGMVYEGSKGLSAKELEKSLFIDPENKNRLTILKSLMENLNSEEKNKLLVANALWIQKDFKVLDKYLEVIQKYYSGEARNLDFINEAEKSRKVINGWVEDKTNDKIKNLIPEGFLDNSIRLVLTNAIYFKGLWFQKFDSNLTKDEDFRTEDGKIIRTPLMRILGKEFKYGEDDNFKILELPYEGENISMILVLPKNGSTYLDYETFKNLKEKLKLQRVEIYIPKFKMEKKYFLTSMLKDMGISLPFKDEADLSGISGKKDLKISDVIHQAFVQVDEEGTEAAAATGITVRLTSVMIQKVPVFRADHPFLFFINHNKTNCVLFSGKVSNPTN